MKPLLLLIIAFAFIGCEPNDPPPRKPTKKHDDFCEKHKIPDSLCTRKNPALAQVFKAKGDWCEEHRTPMSFCPIHNPDAEIPNVDGPPEEAGPSKDEIEGRVVRLKDPAIEKKSGIKTTKAVQATDAATVECLAELKFNANSVADIRAIVPGIVKKVHVQVGQHVKKGDALFTLESTRIGDIQNSLSTSRERVRTARSNLDRQRRLLADKIASARQVEAAENELAAAQSAEKSAKTTLRMAGAGSATTSGRFTLRSPVAGEVVRRPAVVGVLASEAESLATIADTTVLWATCAIPEGDANRVTVGQTLTLELTNGESAQGAISWISPEVDPRTRMVSARADVPNDAKKLRANQFLNANVLSGSSTSAVVVPRGSVQRVESHDVVFVRDRPGLYLPKVVRRLGDGERVAIEGDVAVGDEIVTDGAVLLRTEVLPGSIGAGCCEVEPRGADD